MKFLVDMALSPKTVKALRDSGYEAVRANELGMVKSKDRDILEYAKKNDMIVITADLDFGDILVITGYKKLSVINSILFSVYSILLSFGTKLRIFSIVSNLGGFS